MIHCSLSASEAGGVTKMLSNHSIEGASNGGSSLCSLRKLVSPLFATHVKRYAAPF